MVEMDFFKGKLEQRPRLRDEPSARTGMRSKKENARFAFYSCTRHNKEKWITQCKTTVADQTRDGERTAVYKWNYAIKMQITLQTSVSIFTHSVEVSDQQSEKIREENRRNNGNVASPVIRKGGWTADLSGAALPPICRPQMQNPRSYSKTHTFESRNHASS